MEDFDSAIGKFLRAANSDNNAVRALSIAMASRMLLFRKERRFICPGCEKESTEPGNFGLCIYPLPNGKTRHYPYIVCVSCVEVMRSKEGENPLSAKIEKYYEDKGVFKTEHAVLLNDFTGQASSGEELTAALRDWENSAGFEGPRISFHDLNEESLFCSVCGNQLNGDRFWIETSGENKAKLCRVCYSKATTKDWRRERNERKRERRAWRAGKH